MLRDWGAERKYHHVLKGYNYRLEALQAAILRVKLQHLDAWTEGRRAAAARYDTLLHGSLVETPVASDDSRHVYHVYAVRCQRRAAYRDALASCGVQTGIHYPTPVHLLPAFADLGYGKGTFPESERAANEVLSLPMFPELTCGQSESVVRAIRQFEASEGMASPRLSEHTPALLAM
jgi:dTDP-4-amino-4,6-dideoxygalactose transaminase